jgi:hypothetical protein
MADRASHAYNESGGEGSKLRRPFGLADLEWARGLDAGETMFPPRAPFFLSLASSASVSLPAGQARLRRPIARFLEGAEPTQPLRIPLFARRVPGDEGVLRDENSDSPERDPVFVVERVWLVRFDRELADRPALVVDRNGERRSVRARPA